MLLPAPIICNLIPAIFVKSFKQLGHIENIATWSTPACQVRLLKIIII